MWLFQGPVTYTPQVEVEEVELMSAFVIGHSQALRLKAITETTDCKGRSCSLCWRRVASPRHMPSIDGEVVDTVVGIVLTEKRAVRVCAYKTFTDVYNVQRKAGEQWLVTTHQRYDRLPHLRRV